MGEEAPKPGDRVYVVACYSFVCARWIRLGKIVEPPHPIPGTEGKVFVAIPGLLWRELVPKDQCYVTWQEALAGAEFQRAARIALLNQELRKVRSAVFVKPN